MPEYGNAVMLFSPTGEFAPGQIQAAKDLAESNYAATKRAYPQYGLTNAAIVQSVKWPVVYSSDVLIGSEREGEILGWRMGVGWYEEVGGAS